MAEATKIQTNPTVVRCERLTEDIVRLVVDDPLIARRAQPGHFLAIRAWEADAPLLRRPFSVASSDGRCEVSVIFRVIGVGTKLLAAKRPGETIDVIGPLGHPFEVWPEGPAYLVAGGLGIPPISFLARVLKARNVPVTLYYGVKTKSELGALGDVADFVQRLHISTDDGSAGHQGFISDLVARDVRSGRVYACGPRPLLDVLIRLARERHVAMQLSFEQQMACGVGACMGCSIATADGYQRVCTEGPVFPAEAFFS